VTGKDQQACQWNQKYPSMNMHEYSPFAWKILMDWFIDEPDIHPKVRVSQTGDIHGQVTNKRDSPKTASPPDSHIAIEIRAHIS